MKIDHLQDLSIEDVVRVAVQAEKIEISESTIRAISDSNKRVKHILEAEKPVYGINTGFGIFANKTIDKNSIKNK